MATKLESESRNGTLSINQQTVKQRAKFGARFPSGLGVGRDLHNTIFISSPIDHVQNREQNSESLVGGDVYTTYSNVVDSGIPPTAGFGFSPAELNEISLDYKHNLNPFATSTSYDELTLGSAATDTDNADSTKRFLGFPDLAPPDIQSPTNISSGEGVVDQNLSKGQNVNYGSDTSADRDMNSQSDDNLGYFAISGPGNLATRDNPDTLGQYFKTTGSQE